MSKKAIRILQVGMSTSYGGTEAVVYEIYRHIDKASIQFDFLNVYDGPLARQDWLESLGARVFPLKLKRREGYFRYLHGIKSFYKQHAKEFDAVVCNVQCLDQIAMAKFAKKFGIRKTIVYLHNANYGIRPSQLAKFAICWNKRHCHKYIDSFLACSSLAANWGYSKKDAKLAHIVRQGVDTERMRFSKEKRTLFRNRFGYSENTIIYGSVGRMDPQKNHNFLIDVYIEISKRQPEARFILVGDGPLRNETIQRIKESPISEATLVIPKLDEIELFYSGIDCFILPSRFEGLGMVLIEAQCSGLPCIASESVIPSEVKISDGFKFISLSDGPALWADSVIDLKQSKRDNAYHCVLNSDRGILDTAKEYSKLLS